MLSLSAVLFGYVCLGYAYSFYHGTPVDIDIVLLAALLIPLLSGIFLLRLRKRTQDQTHRAVSSLKQKLDAESTKAKVVIKAITDGVLAVNDEGVIEIINPAACKLVGWNEADARGINYQSVIKLSTQGGEALDPLDQALRTNKPISRSDLELTSATGNKRVVAIHISPLGSGNGAIVVFRNVTDEMLENRQKAEFISTASHEMRTPVAAIEGYLGLALNPQTANIDDKARMYLEKAHESAKHLGRLFQDLLDISRAEDGRLNNNPVIINVTDAVREYVNEFIPSANAKQLKLRYAPDQTATTSNIVAPVYYINADKDHLREIMTNFIENAIKYTPAGEVVVNVTGDEGAVRIEVKDSGIGISPEDIPHLFQKFYRIDNSDTREIGGTGLGLYLCRRLVEAMQGHIGVDSKRGEGSIFFVEFQRVTADEAQAMLAKSAAAQPINPLPESIVIK